MPLAPSSAILQAVASPITPAAPVINTTLFLYQAACSIYFLIAVGWSCWFSLTILIEQPNRINVAILFT